MKPRRFKCSGEAIPMVRLAFEKGMCLRKDPGNRLLTPRSIADFVTQHYGCKPQEVFLVIALSARNEPIHVHEVGTGGFAMTNVDPKVLFAGALLSGASAFVLIHNHPSGDPSPSQQDYMMTQVAVDGAAALGLQVLDHIVVARGGMYVSFLERGQMPAPKYVSPFGSYGDETLEYKIERDDLGRIDPPTPVDLTIEEG